MRLTNQIDARQREEDEELARVLELSKSDKGGRTAAYQTYQSPSASSANVGGSSDAAGSGPGGGRSNGFGNANTNANGGTGGGSGSGSNAHNYQSNAYQPPGAYPQQQQQQQQARQEQPLPPAPLDLNTATRVRALYQFVSSEVGELNFERGDVIKVLDRGFKEWWRGACNGKIGVSLCYDWAFSSQQQEGSCGWSAIGGCHDPATRCGSLQGEGAAWRLGARHASNRALTCRSFP